jgi:FAD/FMN-containing dehydrogenase
VPADERLGEDLAAVTDGAVLTRGLGRSYGDASLPPPSARWVAGSKLADRLLEFDPTTGVLRAEAGLSLETLCRVFLRRGWFTPVSPGTWFVTLGGMVASDVHGKNHHVDGTIGKHVLALKMRVASGDVVTCSRTEHPDLFFATLGGMGLTGHILEVTLRLARIPSRWIWRQSHQMRDFDELITGLERSAEWPQTVCWIDTLATGASFGRGVLMRGRWAEATEAPPNLPKPPFQPTVPFDAPAWTLNDLTIKAFNLLYYHKQIWPRVQGIVSPRSWFAPLDVINEWRRAYGAPGFTQHQCVIPREAGTSAVRAFCDILARRGGSGFLCVIKDCGPEGEGTLSFPRPGMSVALDLPMRGDTQDLVDQLNAFVIEVGGRIYLTKDALSRPEHVRVMEGERLERFLAVRRAWDPELKIRSALSVRLFGDPP